MIPVLYEYDATSFATLGVGSLAETISCEVTEERNGKFELVLKYPTIGALFAELRKERILRVRTGDKPNNLQAFRIYRISKPMAGAVAVYAQHVSYDLSSICVKPFSFEGKTPSQIMSALFSRTQTANGFTFYSDVSNAIDFTSEVPMSLRGALGGEDSLLSRVDGEFEWNNFQVRFLAARGSDSGVTIEYGKNLTGLTDDSDLSAVYTHLMPYAKFKEGDATTTITLTEGVLPIVTTLSKSKTLIMDFSSYFQDADANNEATLRAYAQAYLAANPLGIEAPQITVSLEPLWRDRSFAAIEERINLCDWVTVRFPDLGVDAKSKVVKVVYDCLLEKYKSITLGSIKPSLVDSIQQIGKEVKETETVVRDIPSQVEDKIKNATDLITGAKGGCVVLRTDSSTGKPYELLVMDDPDITQAENVWRWNIGGLGFSSNGYNGPYATAITADGNIVADFITAGTLTADVIHAGTIASTDGTSWWNIETGDVNLSGTVHANAGNIGNFTINADGISTGPTSINDARTPGLFLATAGINFNASSTGENYRSFVTVKPTGAVDGQGIGPHIHGGMKSSNIIDMENSFILGSRLLSMKEYTEPDDYFDVGPAFRIRLTTTEAALRYVSLYAFPAMEGEDECVEEGNEGKRTALYIGVGHLWDSYIGYVQDTYIELFAVRTGDAGNYGRLHGSWRSDSAITVVSDRDKKEEIEDLPDSYSALFDGLRPVRFRYKDGTSKRRHTGFVAQEVAEAAENAGLSLEDVAAVCRNESATEDVEWGLRYEELIALCVKEIQALKLEVKRLKEEKE